MRPRDSDIYLLSARETMSTRIVLLDKLLYVCSLMARDLSSTVSRSSSYINTFHSSSIFLFFLSFLSLCLLSQLYGWLLFLSSSCITYYSGPLINPHLPWLMFVFHLYQVLIPVRFCYSLLPDHSCLQVRVFGLSRQQYLPLPRSIWSWSKLPLLY